VVMSVGGGRLPDVERVQFHGSQVPGGDVAESKGRVSCR
jgi:hypothetical protein